MKSVFPKMLNCCFYSDLWRTAVVSNKLHLKKILEIGCLYCKEVKWWVVVMCCLVNSQYILSHSATVTAVFLLHLQVMAQKTTCCPPACLLTATPHCPWQTHMHSPSRTYTHTPRHTTPPTLDSDTHTQTLKNTQTHTYPHACRHTLLTHWNKHTLSLLIFVLQPNVTPHRRCCRRD